VHFLKYEDFPGVKYPISRIVAAYLQKSDFLDVSSKQAKPEIIPIPLHFLKKISRGFNQAEDIAIILSASTGWPINNRLLQRIKNTEPQAQIGQRSERLANLTGSFRVNPRFRKDVIGKTFIVVDDVFTSGATMSEAVKTLRSAGAKKAVGFVFAKS
jgi:ComF family protein